MKSLDTLKQLVNSKFESTKQEIKSECLKYGEAILVKYVLPNVSDFVRAVIISKGKNPDYVPPPPAPPEEKKPSATRPSFRWNNPVVPTWTRESFDKPSKHPILQSRAEIRRNGLKTEPPPEEEGLFVTASAASEPGLSPSEALLRRKARLIEIAAKIKEAAGDPPVKKSGKKAAKKSVKKAVKKAKKSAKVVKNFNGSFRRIEE